MFEARKYRGLNLRRDKCHLVFEELDFLGLRFNAEGVALDPSKVKAIRDFPVPTRAAEVKRLCGMAAYAARFVKNLAKLLSPLNMLTKKGSEFK